MLFLCQKFRRSLRYDRRRRFDENTRKKYNKIDLVFRFFLGHLLSILCVDPQLGRLVLGGLVLRCLDPVLTIAAASGSRDPFIQPMHPDLQVSPISFYLLSLSSFSFPFLSFPFLLSFLQGWRDGILFDRSQKKLK
jgi:hypothetical protein